MTLVRILFMSALLMLTAGSAFAVASASADCNNNGSTDLTCSGTDCQSTDGPTGGCLCTTSEGGYDSKTCLDLVGIFGPDAPPGSQASVIWNELFPAPADSSGLEQPEEAAIEATDNPVDSSREAE